MYHREDATTRGYGRTPRNQARTPGGRSGRSGSQRRDGCSVRAGRGARGRGGVRGGTRRRRERAGMGTTEWGTQVSAGARSSGVWGARRPTGVNATLSLGRLETRPDVPMSGPGKRRDSGRTLPTGSPAAEPVGESGTGSQRAGRNTVVPSEPEVGPRRFLPAEGSAEYRGSGLCLCL